MRLLAEDASLLETEETRVFYKTISGQQDSIASWIDSNIESIREEFCVKKNSEIGILVRGGVSGLVIKSALETKHRYLASHPLEEHFSLWARLFCQLLSYRFDTTITAQEIAEQASVSLAKPALKSLKTTIRQLRVVGQEKLVEPMIAVAETLIPNARSDDAVNLLIDSLAGDLQSFFSPAKDDEIQIMSLHKSKGLEFNVVFHLDLYEWVLPAKRPGENNDFDNPVYPSSEQDAKLHYVGITRARNACFLCTSTRRVSRDYKTGSLVSRNGSPSEFFQIHDLNELREISPYLSLIHISEPTRPY